MQTAVVEPVDVDMEGRPTDAGMRSAVEIVHQQAPSEPTFAGMWIDESKREVHLAFTDSTADGIVHHLETYVPRTVRLQPHDAQHTLATLEDLHQAYSEYMESTGYRPSYTVDSGVRLKANAVHANLKDTTPPDVVATIRARFADAPLQIELTTARWTTP